MITAEPAGPAASVHTAAEGITYVFGTRYDTPQQAQVIRDQFRAVVDKAGIPGSWTPRELRHSFVSLMFD